MSESERILKIYNILFHSNHKSLDVFKSENPEWDSMKHAELVLKLQKEFLMYFKVEDILEVKNLQDFLPLVKK